MKEKNLIKGLVCSKKVMESRQAFIPCKVMLLTLIMVSFLLAIGMVNAGFTVQGDFPDTGLNYRVEAYSAPQTNMCDGAPDSGVMYFSSTYAPGDNAYNDNDDYVGNYTGTLGGPTTVYFYLCGPGGNSAAKIDEFTKTVNDDANLEIDIGYINGTTAVHDDLANNYVVVCSNFNGTLPLSSVSKQAGASGEYTQYFHIDKGSISTSEDDPAQVYVFFDSDSFDCTWGSTKKAGKIIYISSSAPDNYGVYGTFEPDTKVTGDAHADLADATMMLYNASNYNVGIARIRNAADGGTGNDDYTLYYDNPITGDLELIITPDGNPIPSTHQTTISNIDRTAFANGGYDFIYKVSNDTHGIPTDINEVKVSMTIVSDAVVFSTTPVTSGSVNVYDLFVDDAGDGTDDVEFYVGSSKVLAVSKNLGTGGSDVKIDVGKVSGEAHEGIESGANDNITVHNDSDCSGSPHLLSSERVNASDNTAGVDFAVYFLDDGSSTFYIKVNKDGTYATCGNAFNLTNQVATRNLDVEITGKVPTDIDKVGSDIDNDDDMTDLGEASTVPSSGTYYLYLDYAVGGANNKILFYKSGTLELKRTKNLTTSQTVNVGKVVGDVHSDLSTGGDDLISVYSDRTCTTPSSSEIEHPTAGAGDNDDYTQYYEQNGSTNYIKTTMVDGSNSYETCGAKVEFGQAGDTTVVDILSEVNGSVPNDVSSVGIDDDQNNTDDYTQTVVATSPKTYKMHIVADNSANISFYISGRAEPVLKRENKDFSGTAATINVAEFSGSINDSFYEGGSASVDVYDDYTNRTIKYNSTSIIADDGSTDNYKVFFEDPNTAEAVDIKFTDDDGNISWANDATDSDGKIDAGDNIDFDLEYTVTGAVPIDVTYVKVRDSGDNDVVFGIAEPKSNGTYKMYVADGTGSYILVSGTARPWNADDESLDVDKMQYAVEKAGTVVLTKTTNFEAFTGNDLFSAGKLFGTVPGTGYLAGGKVKAYTSQAQDCGAGYVSEGNIGTGGKATYEIYVPSNTQYYYDFCESDEDTAYETFEAKTVDASSIGASEDLDLAVVSGTMDDSFSQGANANILVYDNFNDTQIGGNLNTDYDGTAIAGSYVVYFEVSGSHKSGDALTDESVRLEQGTITDVALKITDNDGCVAWVIGVEGNSDWNKGDAITLNLSGDDVSGVVPSDITYVVIEDASNEYAIGVPKATGSYKIWTPDLTSVTLTLEKNGKDVLKYNVASLVSGQKFDAIKVVGDLDSDFADKPEDNIEIYNDASCTNLLSSEDANITQGAGNDDDYEQYARDDGSTKFYIKLIQKDVSDTYTTCGQSFSSPGASGTATGVDATVRVEGTVPSDIDEFQVDADEDGTFELKANMSESYANANTYKLYFIGDDSADIRFMAGGNEKLRNVANQLGSSVDLSANKTIDVARVVGTSVHADLTDDDDKVHVCQSFHCTGTIFADEEKDIGPTGYEIYFWLDPNSHDFWLQVKDAGTTNYYSYVNLVEINGGGISAGDTIDVNLDKKIYGDTPHTNAPPLLPIDMMWLRNSLAYPMVKIYYAGDPAADGTYKIFHSYTGDYAILASTSENPNSNVLARGITVGNENEFNVAAVYSTKACHSNLLSNSDITVVTLPYDGGEYLSYEPVLCTASGYAQYFYQPTQAATYYLKVQDAAEYRTYHVLTATTNFGDAIVQDLGGLFSGTVVEAYDNSTPIADVNVYLIDDSGSPMIAHTISKTNGTFRIYSAGDGNSGFNADTYDANFVKIGYITESADNNSTINNFKLNANVIIPLSSGIVVTVKDDAGNNIPDATVEILTNTNPITLLGGCKNPAGTCRRSGNNTAGNGANGEYHFNGFDMPQTIWVRAYKNGWEVATSPPADQAGYTVNSYTPYNITVYINDEKPQPVTLISPGNGTYTADTTPEFSWYDLGSDEVDYNIQVDDDPNFSSPVIDTSVGDGDTTTYTPTTALSDETIYYWRVAAVDREGLGNWSEIRSFTVDTRAPTIDSFSIDAGASYTKSRAVYLNIKATGAAYCNFSNYSDANWSGWFAYSDSNSYPWTLTSGDGTKTVYAQCKDSAGNIVGPISDTIVLDTTAPSLTFVINDGNQFTNSTSISVDINAYDASSVTCYWSLNNSTWTEFSTCTETNSIISIPSGDGLKEVFFKAVDSAGNTATTSDTIVLDTTAPTTPTAKFPTEAITTISRAFEWQWNESSGTGSPIDHYIVTLSTGTTTVDTYITKETKYTAPIRDMNDDKTYVLTVVAFDQAGNNSGTLTFPNVTIDLDSPITKVTSPTGDTNNTTPTISISVTSAVQSCKFIVYVNNVSGGEISVLSSGSITPSSQTCSWTIPSGNLSHLDTFSIAATVTDKAGNERTLTFPRNYLIDTNPPVVRITSPSSGTLLSDTTPKVYFTIEEQDFHETGIDSDAIWLYVNDELADVEFDCNATNGLIVFSCSAEVPESAAFTDGTTGNKITIKAADLAGNYSTPVAVTDLSVDTTDYITVNSVTAVRTTGIADDTYANGWRFDFNVTFGVGSLGDDKNRLRVKLDDWVNTSNSSYTIEVEGNARMVYDANINGTKSTQIYNIANDYNTSAIVYPFWDHNPLTPGIDANFYIEQKIPSSVAAGTYYTTYYIKNYSNTV